MVGSSQEGLYKYEVALKTLTAGVRYGHLHTGPNGGLRAPLILLVSATNALCLFSAFRRLAEKGRSLLDVIPMYEPVDLYMGLDQTERFDGRVLAPGSLRPANDGVDVDGYVLDYYADALTAAYPACLLDVGTSCRINQNINHNTQDHVAAVVAGLDERGQDPNIAFLALHGANMTFEGCVGVHFAGSDGPDRVAALSLRLRALGAPPLTLMRGTSGTAESVGMYVEHAQLRPLLQELEDTFAQHPGYVRCMPVMGTNGRELKLSVDQVRTRARREYVSGPVRALRKHGTLRHTITCSVGEQGTKPRCSRQWRERVFTPKAPLVHPPMAARSVGLRGPAPEGA